jgi:iron complex outermembrane receptor protein
MTGDPSPVCDRNWSWTSAARDRITSPDPVTGEPVYYLAGSAVTQGLELESNILVTHGVGVYLNATTGSAKYVDTDLWVQNAPRDTEAIGLSYNQSNWNVGFFNKRIGRMYNDNSGINQAVAIDPFYITNLFVNYTLKGSNRFSQSKIRLSVNNLFDKRYIVGVTPAAKTTSLPTPGDVLNLMAARSVSLTFTVGFSPK